MTESGSGAPLQLNPGTLSERAAQVLSDNHTGSMTKAAPGLYPHQWSWDAAFIALGWATVNVATAARELDSLFAGQWRNGMVPHIVFDPHDDGYFPGPDSWACATASPDAPKGVLTSGLCQPPVHAIAASAIYAAGQSSAATRSSTRRWLEALYPRLLAWHRYLGDVRRDERTGLMAIIHGWESGTDNSPRWDRPYARVVAGNMDAFVRRDIDHVGDRAQRPDDRDYRRYIWLLEEAKRSGYDARKVRAHGSFVVGDVLFTAILAAASDALAGLADAIGAPDGQDLRASAADARRAVLDQVDPATGLAADVDLRTGEPLRSETVAGFAPLVAGETPAGLRRQLTELLMGSRWAGHPRMRWPLPPSTSPAAGEFSPRSYWRGPVWPVISWLLSWSLSRAGETSIALQIAEASLSQLAEGSFAEYYDPCTGEPLGSRNQSWTAAVTLDWLLGGVALIGERV